MGLRVDGSQFRTLYLHSSSMPESRDVKAGEEIGKIGDKRAAGKPHLHFEVQVPKSAVTSTKCIVGQDTNDCAFPVGGGKRDPNGYATSQSLASASPNTWFYVNPERYLKERVPVVGNAAARTGRSQSLPNSCTPGTSPAETPISTGDSDPAASLAGGFGNYLSGEGSGVANADKELRSIVIDIARQSALDVRAASSSAAQ
ncbi:M23 family metallopeptidase, partial [Brucella sp. NBRC 113783]